MFVRPHFSEGHVALLSPEEGGESGGSGGGGGHDDTAALRSQLADAQKALDAFKATEAQRASDTERATAAERERMKKAGEVEKLIEAQNADLAALRAKLTELEPDAAYGRETRKQQIDRIEAAKKDLPEADQALLTSAMQTGNINLADQMLARIKGAKAPARPGAPGGPPGMADVPDFDKLASESPQGFRDAVKKYPREWESHKEKLRGPQTRQPTLNERTASRMTLLNPAKKAG